MISQDEHTKALLQLQAFSDAITQAASADLVLRVQYHNLQQFVKSLLDKGMQAPATEEIITQSVAAPVEDDPVITEANRTYERVSPAEKTAKLKKTMEELAYVRASLSSFIKQDDKVVTSINSPSGYKQTVINTMNSSEEILRLVFATSSHAYMVTEGPNKGLAVTLAKNWKIKK